MFCFFCVLGATIYKLSERERVNPVRAMKIYIRFLIWSSIYVMLFCVVGGLCAQECISHATRQAKQSERGSDHDREVASLFAPVFYQALGDKPRSDYITNFDFDGDWRGDNNWANAENTQFPLMAYVYYSVSETSSQFFIHYAVFHPRDYKGGDQKGAILSALIREAAERGGKYDPTGLADETVLAHENDMEGCLVVVAKSGRDLRRARVVFVETLHHNVFSKYVAGEPALEGFDPIRIDESRVLLYVEPKGHGIEAYDGGEKQIAKKRMLIYTFSGTAESPVENQEGSLGYDLVPIESTLWSRIRMKPSGPASGTNAMYGATHDFGTISINVMQPNRSVVIRKFKLGKLGSAFLGSVGGRNMAKPPWAWFDRNHRDDALGLWFFDPAQIIKRDFKLDESFSTTYVRLPFWAADR